MLRYYDSAITRNEKWNSNTAHLFHFFATKTSSVFWMLKKRITVWTQRVTPNMCAFVARSIPLASLFYYINKNKIVFPYAVTAFITSGRIDFTSSQKFVWQILMFQNDVPEIHEWNGLCIEKDHISQRSLKGKWISSRALCSSRFSLSLYLFLFLHSKRCERRTLNWSIQPRQTALLCLWLTENFTFAFTT